MPDLQRKKAIGSLTALVCVSAFVSGCVERKIRVTSEPPGARVWLNDQHIGTTPVDTRFTFYGGYDVRVELSGYEPVNELRQAKAPLHEYPGIDLVAHAIPHKFDTLIEWHFDLEQVPEASDPESARENLLDRAADLREQARSNTD
jgi:PEGA domain